MLNVKLENTALTCILDVIGNQIKSKPPEHNEFCAKYNLIQSDMAIFIRKLICHTM